MSTEFKLPELGENIESGDIVDILVTEGDIVEKDQNLLEIETDKAVIEVPSPVQGKIQEVHIGEGDNVKVGALLFTIEETEEEPPGEEESEATAEPAEIAVQEEAESGGAQATAPEREAGVSPPEAGAPKPEEPWASKVQPPSLGEQPVYEPPGPGNLVPAAPSVRRLAREIGVDIKSVPGTGPEGRITQEDVKKYSKQLHTQRQAAAGAPISTEPLPDFSKWGPVETEPMSNVRRKTAEHMMSSWAPVPHVTQYDSADITDLDALRKRWSSRAEARGGKLTVTAILVKVVAAALKVFPKFNASIDMGNKQVIYKQYYHIGIAVDTERGLLVPVIQDVNQKNILDLAVEIQELAQKARDRKLGMDEMQGGCFSVTNLGGIGGTNFSPIVNAPEVAILGVSRARMEPVYRDGEFEPRLMLPLSLSYDHRLVDGADAARFLRWVCNALEEPLLLALEG